MRGKPRLEEAEVADLSSINISGPTIFVEEGIELRQSSAEVGEDRQTINNTRFP